jgi:hypothetical protein
VQCYLFRTYQAGRLKNGKAEMKKIEYKVVVSNNGFSDFEEKVSKMLGDGWKPVGGVAFNHSYPHQAMARVIDVQTNQDTPKEKAKALTANEAMKRLDDLT